MTIEEARERARVIEHAAAVIADFRAEEERAGRAILLTADELAAYAQLDAGWTPPSAGNDESETRR
ncbi:hypothetical protein [Curtobacterium sp. 20TX0008]|uniref:hypothetical protein n=1 Tax=Curtobacterium sp. 20TX0008 TaxID=3022018 RepID=UPI0023308ED3|nr:hypothetical protein [Curtobacterium sp. 20TX0008]MDB6425852.1 hypothetical protein [Curtobacterium sp. 20TX0008]